MSQSRDAFTESDPASADQVVEYDLPWKPDKFARTCQELWLLLRYNGKDSKLDHLVLTKDCQVLASFARQGVLVSIFSLFY